MGSEDAIEDGLHSREIRTRTEARQQAERVEVRSDEGVFRDVRGDGDPHVHHGLRLDPGESRPGDPDHGIRHLLVIHGPADHRRVRLKAAGPERMTQNGHAIAAEHVVILRFKEPADGGIHPERGEVICGYGLSDDAFGRGNVRPNFRIPKVDLARTSP